MRSAAQPNHIHLLWKIMPPYTLKEVQLSFMKYTAQMIKFDLQKHHPQVLEKFYVVAKDRQYQFWESNPLTTYLYERKIVEQKLDYIHHNPVNKNWNLVSDWVDYFIYYLSVACMFCLLVVNLLKIKLPQIYLW
jgi:putative transposase